MFVSGQKKYSHLETTQAIAKHCADSKVKIHAKDVYLEAKYHLHKEMSSFIQLHPAQTQPHIAPWYQQVNTHCSCAAQFHRAASQLAET